MNSVIPANADLTIYNKYHRNGKEEWHRTHIKGVSWIGTKGVTTSTTGATRSNEAKVRIPGTAYANGRSYTDMFRNQDGEMIDENTWTISEGDTIVSGMVDFARPSLIPDEMAFKIKNYSDNRDSRIPKYMWHWRITAQ